MTQMRWLSTTSFLNPVRIVDDKGCQVDLGLALVVRGLSICLISLTNVADVKGAIMERPRRRGTVIPYPIVISSSQSRQWRGCSVQQ